jgi:hypothetical protein
LSHKSLQRKEKNKKEKKEKEKEVMRVVTTPLG